MKHCMFKLSFVFTLLVDQYKYNQITLYIAKFHPILQKIYKQNGNLKVKIPNVEGKRNLQLKIFP